ncbi:hypothetical protein NPIL_584271, partial [Nephila pilipes]
MGSFVFVLGLFRLGPVWQMTGRFVCFHRRLQTTLVALERLSGITELGPPGFGWSSRRHCKHTKRQALQCSEEKRNVYVVRVQSSCSMVS